MRTNQGRHRPRGRVLLVEGHRCVRDALEDLLVAEGFAVSSVETSEEGAQAVQQLNPDVILLDVGLDVGAAHRAGVLGRRRSGPRVAVIALSAYGVPGQADSHGFNYWHLLEKVDQAVAESRAS